MAITNIVKLLDKSFDSKRNVIKISKHNTLSHELAKCKLCIMLKQDGVDFVTEAIFKNNKGRADVFLIDRLEVYEVLESETEEKFKKKQEDYPIEVTVFGIRAKDILDDKFVL